MQATGRLSVLLAWLLLASGEAAGSGSVFPVTFQSPAQLDGNVDLQGLGWAVLLFHEEVAEFNVHAQGAAAAVNHTVGFVDTRLPETIHWRQGFGMPDQSTDLGAGFDANISLGSGAWSSLYIQAESIRLAAKGIDGSMELPRQDYGAAGALPPGGQPLHAVRPSVWPTGIGTPAFSLKPGPGQSASGFEVEASGVRVVEWHGARVDCPRTQACPDGGGTQNHSVPLPNGDYATFLLAHYGQLDMQDGALRGQGVLLAAAAGSERLDVAMQGVVRLPLADVQGPCPNCPPLDNRTLRIEGNLSLASLKRHDAGRFSAGLGGDVASARLDEAGFLLDLDGWTVPTAAAGASLLAVALWKFGGRLLGLFSRELDDPLKQPTRRKLYHAVQKHPGASFRDLVRLTGINRGSVHHQLKVLIEHGLVVRHDVGHRSLYFENHGKHAGTWQGTATLRNPELRRLHAWLRRHGPVRQAAAVQAATAWGWTPATTKRRMVALAEAGLAQVTPQGRARTYRALAAKPSFKALSVSVGHQAPR